jgi:hypothetical protein
VKRLEPGVKPQVYVYHSFSTYPSYNHGAVALLQRFTLSMGLLVFELSPPPFCTLCTLYHCRVCFCS